MKPSANFKLKKQYKRRAARFVDPHKRGEYLRAMIQAQLTEEEVRRQPLNKKDRNEN